MMLHADADFPSSPVVQESSLKILQHRILCTSGRGWIDLYLLLFCIWVCRRMGLFMPFFGHLNVLNDGVLHWLVLDLFLVCFWAKPDEEITPKQIYQKTHHQYLTKCKSRTSTQDICICDSISQALQIPDAFETCVVSKVAMMAALGAVAQHYIKFPGFDAGWQGRVEVARRSESSRISSNLPSYGWL